MDEKKFWKAMAQEPPASPIEGMSFTEYHIFAQQAAQEAFDLGLAKPEDIAVLLKRSQKSGERGAE